MTKKKKYDIFVAMLSPTLKLSIGLTAFFLTFITFLLTSSQTVRAAGNQYFVNPAGNDSSSGTSSSSPFKTIQKAVDLAQPGDTINLASGIYLQDVVSKRNGMPESPITVRGPQDVVIKGGGNDRIIEINHDYITLNGFTIDGLFGSSGSKSGYRDKLLYILGKETRRGVTGIKITNINFKNAGGECLRLRYFTQINEISYNTFQNCGVYDFKFSDGGKNGEAVYIGTAPEQLSDGKNPTTDPDQSNNNWIHHNSVNTQGNECVDIKEASTNNLVEYNKCTGNKDADAAGFSSRGNGNIFRWNELYSNVGAGIRLGGDTSKEGINNDIYANNIHDNKSGGIRFQRTPQGNVCGNTMTNNSGGNSTGTYESSFSPTSTCAAGVIPVSPTPTPTPTPTVAPSPLPTNTNNVELQLILKLLKELVQVVESYLASSSN